MMHCGKFLPMNTVALLALTKAKRSIAFKGCECLHARPAGSLYYTAKVVLYLPYPSHKNEMEGSIIGGFAAKHPTNYPLQSKIGAAKQKA